MEIKTKKVLPSPVSFTEGAVKEIRQLWYERENVSEEASEEVLRIGVKGGGCSGLSYILGFDKQTEEDEVFAVEDIPVIINRAHAMYVIGMEVDFLNGLQNRGFMFNNPNAKETCGCGTSFSTDDKEEA